MHTRTQTCCLRSAGLNDEVIEEFLRSCHGVMRAPLAYIVRKTITVQIYGNYPKFATPDDEMITKMLHLPPNKNGLPN